MTQAKPLINRLYSSESKAAKSQSKVDSPVDRVVQQISDMEFLGRDCFECEMGKK